LRLRAIKNREIGEGKVTSDSIDNIIAPDLDISSSDIATFSSNV